MRKNGKMKPANTKRNSVSFLSAGIGTRIDAAARAIGTRVQAAKAAGISDDMLYRYIREESPPSFSAMAGLAKQANVSLNWMAWGEGSKEWNVRESTRSYGNNEGQGNIDQDLLQDVIEILEELQERHGTRWEPAVMAEITTAVYDYLYHEENPTIEDRERFLNLIQSIVNGVSSRAENRDQEKES